MKSADFDARQVMEALTSLQREVQQLGERLTALERRPAAAPAVSPPPVEIIPAEIVAALSSAIAAYLGVKPHIRQIRLVRSEAWAQYGRVTLQASHELNAVRSTR